MTLVLVVLSARPDRQPGPAATPSTTATPAPTALPALPVSPPPPVPHVDRPCTTLISKLPVRLVDLPARPVDSSSPYAVAWGAPPVVLRCGMPRPAGFTATAGIFTIDGVDWFVRDDAPNTVYTAVDRSVYVEVVVPTQYPVAAVTALSRTIGTALPARVPTPGPTR